MNLGPYQILNGKLAYRGNKVFKPINEVRNIKPSNLSKRHLEVKRYIERWNSLIRIWDTVFRASNKFMELKNVLFFDLPITTRMISSPGALTGTIPSDVNPFKIKFFNQDTFLTQSSQLYLEFAITNPKINSVYCWEKSFRREKADFRHLPEFTHIEFESNFDFEKNLKFQEEYLKFVINYLIKNRGKEIQLFLNNRDVEELKRFSGINSFEQITFHEAFKILKQKVKSSKYNHITIKNFGAYEEVLLTQIINKPLFITHFIVDEVAFYHANDHKNPKLAINADFLFPGYGELIGSGERVHTRAETRTKVKHFKLNMKDYQPYIKSRVQEHPVVHSGWGMGIERFIQAILKLPFIWETKLFSRVDTQNRP